ncbi:MAG: AAA family ATPase, partial [Solirubrobacteraceae bacterium]|nr:AAA family ATPase [Solirubrobacteraceae bacterium]
MLIERDAPIRRLRALAAQAAGGAGSCVVIEGGAGIGKTALLRHLRDETTGLGLRVLSATGADLERDHAFGIARQLLEPLWRGLGTEERATLLDGPAALARPLVELTPAPVPLSTGVGASQRGGIAGAVEAQSVLHGTSWLIGTLAEQSPLMLVVDDAHWADEPSLDLLAYVARRLADLPVLLVIARRPVALGDAVVDPPGEHLRLQPLSASGIGAVAEAVLGPGQGAGLAEACLAATGGNPLYVRALLDELEGRPDRPTGPRTENATRPDEGG